jgi:hypothetical protein
MRMGEGDVKNQKRDNVMRGAIRPIWDALKITVREKVQSLFLPVSKAPAFYVPFVAGMAGEVVPESFFVLRVSGNG